MGGAPLPLGPFCLGLGFLAITGVFTVWKSPVGGGQAKGTDMLPLWVFVALEASLEVEIFASSANI